MKKLNSVRLPHYKRSKSTASVEFSGTKTAVFPMSQHIGAPCEPVVAAGDEVKVGQLVADSASFMSAPIHSSVSGVVREIKDIMPPNGRPCKAVVVESDGRFDIFEGIEPPKVTDKQSFIDAVRKSGAVGLGGAAFPTSVKLSFDKAKTPVDTLVINGAECEPFICSDHREMLENTLDIVGGIKAVLDYLEIPKAVIGIESNKPDAIAVLSDACADDDRITVKSLKSTYPQGAEKMLVHSTVGRVVKEGELPLNAGVIVMNVTTVGFIYRYLKTGMPLIKKRITVDGDSCKDAMNLIVPIGTPISEILEYINQNGECAPKLVLMGGPMMGIPVADINYPVIKNNNAILFFNDRKPPQVTACMRCGSCVRACPMKLMPTELEKAYDRKDFEALDKLKVNLCINCGSCSYVCPAKRSLAQKNQLAKTMLMNEKKRLEALKK